MERDRDENKMRGEVNKGEEGVEALPKTRTNKGSERELERVGLKATQRTSYSSPTSLRACVMIQIHTTESGGVGYVKEKC